MNSAEMPKYKCHKEVWALKIAEVEVLGNGEVILCPEDKSYENILLDKEFQEKHNPYQGGYYVIYAGGYKSFSPSDAFESGYTKID